MVEPSKSDRSGGVRRLWEGMVGAVDALIFPMTCRACGVEGLVEPFCKACREELLGASAGACGRCAMPVGPWGDREEGCSECRGKRLGFDGAMALGPYDGPIRSLCLDLKREGEAWLGRWAADLVIEAHGEKLKRLGAARVVAVPLHWKRRLQRGYDQAEALARPLARGLGLKVERVLKRVKATEKLAELGRTERAGVMKGAFEVVGGKGFAGETVILVDDILTTGATCGAAARALKRAGARKVVVVVIGRAEGRV